MRIELSISDITDDNRKDKFLKAIEKLSAKLNIVATIKHKEHHKENFPFTAQEELYNRYILKYGLIMDDLYSRVCATLGLRPVSTFKKSIEPGAAKLGKEIIWNPETGIPITQKDLDKLLGAIDKFLNKNVGAMKKEFVISQSSIGRIIANLRKNNSFDDIRGTPLDVLKIRGKKWSALTNYAELNDSFPDNYDRLKFRERVVGNYIQNVNETSRNKIRDVLDQGFMAGKSKGEISQELFDKFGDMNRDWDRIVDTEGVNIFNAEFIEEQMKDSLPGEPIYFIRREFADDRTCSFCIKATQEQIIARWSDVPLQDENIDDPFASIALWSGKTNYGKKRDEWQWSEGPIHCNCRGSWDRIYPEIGEIEL